MRRGREEGRTLTIWPFTDGSTRGRDVLMNIPYGEFSTIGVASIVCPVLMYVS